MKVAFVLHGMAEAVLEYNAHEDRGWDTSVKGLVDYRNSLQNYKDSLISDNGLDVDVYFHTWDTDELNDKKELVRSFNTINYSITDQIVDSSVRYGVDRAKSRQKSLINALQCVENPHEYDFFVVSRFDLHFETDLAFLIKNKLDEDLLYFGFDSMTHELVDDNVFIFGNELFDDFFKTLTYIYTMSNSRNLHLFGKYWMLKTRRDYGFLTFNGNRYDVEVNPIYHIVRHISPIGKDNFEFVFSPEKDINCKYCKN